MPGGALPDFVSILVSLYFITWSLTAVRADVICFSRTWDKKIPPEVGFLLFLSVTARCCLVQAVWYSLLFIYVSTYDVTTQSATFPATSEGFHDVKEKIIGIFLFKMHISMRYEKNNQVPVLNPDRQISVSGDTMSHPSFGYHLDWYFWHRITLDWDLSVWI